MTAPQPRPEAVTPPGGDQHLDVCHDDDQNATAAAPMSQAEAILATTKVKGHVRKASWAYQALDHGRVVQELTAAAAVSTDVDVDVTEAQARDIKPVIGEVAAVVREAVADVEPERRAEVVKLVVVKARKDVATKPARTKRKSKRELTDEAFARALRRRAAREEREEEEADAEAARGGQQHRPAVSLRSLGYVLAQLEATQLGSHSDSPLDLTPQQRPLVVKQAGEIQKEVWRLERFAKPAVDLGRAGGPVTDDALHWLAEVQRHTDAAVIIIGHHRAGILPDELHVVDVLAVELGAIGRAADYLGAVLR